MFTKIVEQNHVHVCLIKINTEKRGQPRFKWGEIKDNKKLLNWENLQIEWKHV